MTFVAFIAVLAPLAPKLADFFVFHPYGGGVELNSASLEQELLQLPENEREAAREVVHDFLPIMKAQAIPGGPLENKLTTRLRGYYPGLALVDAQKKMQVSCSLKAWKVGYN